MPKKNLNDICVQALSDNKAEDVLSLDIEGISSFADNIIIATANSNRHAKSLSEKLIDSIKNNKMSKIIDCVTFFQENLQMEIRFSILKDIQHSNKLSNQTIFEFR